MTLLALLRHILSPIPSCPRTHAQLRTNSLAINLYCAPETQAWDSKTTFILASIGCAVGIGNIWRFPYMCYRNGGAAFMIPYLISVFTLGYPLFVLETALGQGTGKSPIGALGSLCPRLKGLAWLGFSANACITCYYMVVLSWCLRYLLASCTTGPLPFADGNAPYYFQSVMLDKRFLCEAPKTRPEGWLPLANVVSG